MKISEVQQMNDEECRAELERLRRHLFDLRAQSVTEKLEDTTMIAKAKRDIARLMTVIRQRELRAEEAAGSADRKSVV